MAAHNLERSLRRSEHLLSALCAVLMIDAVESVAANAALEPLIGTRIDRRGQWHLAVKTGIEDGHLSNSTQKILYNLHAFQFRPNVERSEIRHAVDGGPHFARDHHWFFKMRTAMDDAVSHDVDLRSRADHARLSIMHGAQQVPDELLARGNWQFFLEGDSL